MNGAGIEVISAVAAAVLGAVLGSFVTLVSHRLPRGGSLVRGRSRCPSCGTVLGLRDLMPLVSWLASRGRCRHCGAPVGARYPVIEAVMAALFLAVYLRFGVTVPAALLGAAAVLLVTLAAIDLETGFLPDAVQVPLLLLGVGYRWWAGDLIQGLVGLALAGALAYAVRFGYGRLTGREGLGLGDVKFFGVAGLWLGPTGLPAFMVLGGGLGLFVGLVWRRLVSTREFPFGPALAAALFAILLFPELARVFV